MSVIVTKLVEFTVQTAVRVNEWEPAVSERVGVFVAVEAMSPVLSEGSGAGGGREKDAPEGSVFRFKRVVNSDTLCLMLFF